MARVWFAKGVQGEIVRKIQLRLKESGFDPKGIDGDFGPNTVRALRRFQEQHGLEPTGEADTASWKRLMRSAVPAVADRCLQLTAAFEGHGFDRVQGNFDGAGLTWGIIGFTLRHQGIRKVVRTIHEQHPELVREAFGTKTPELISIVGAPWKERLAWADSVSLGKTKTRLAQPWRRAFERFGAMEPVQALQVELANKEYFQPAVQTAREYALRSELGLALAFDIHVQNGGVKKKVREQIRRIRQQHSIAGEREMRIILAHSVADASKARWREDVRARKLTIATGSGKVHREWFVLRNWGLGEAPVRTPTR